MNSRFSRKAALKAALLIAGSTYVTYAIGLIVSALVARLLGPDQYGRYAYTVWLSGVLVILGNHGLTTTAIRFIAEALGTDAPRTARAVHDWLYRRQIASILAVVGIFLMLFPFLLPAGWSNGMLLFPAVVSIATLTKALYLFQISTAKGQGRFSVEAYSSVLVSSANAIGAVVLFLLGAELQEFLILFALTSILYYTVSSWLLSFDHLTGGADPLAADMLDRVRRHLFWTIVLTGIAAFSGTSISTFLLNALVGAAQVGYFVIAATLSRGAIEMVSVGLTSVLMPMMGHAFGTGGRERVDAILFDALRYLQLLGIVAAVVGAFWAKPIVVLVYGDAYGPVVDILRWMLLAAGMTLGESAIGALLSTTDNQRIRALFAASSLVLSLLAALILVPLMGLTGAVVAHVTVRLTLYLIGLAIASRYLEIRLPWRDWGRQYVALALAGPTALLVAVALPEFWGEIAAGMAFPLLLLVLTLPLGIWQDRDLRLALGLLDRYPRRLSWARRYLERRLG